jgi:hypothetical protein
VKATREQTLDAIRARCRECGECLEWTGPDNGNGFPKCYSRFHGRHMAARRAVWECHHRKRLPRRRLVTVSCDNLRCLNPKHLALTTKAQVSHRVRLRVDVRLRQAAALARTKRATDGKLTMYLAGEIRATTGELLLDDWAALLCVSRSTISLVRRNLRWAEHGGHFGGLMFSGRQ